MRCCMRKKWRVALTIGVCTLFFTACGESDGVPATMAGLPVVEIRQQESQSGNVEENNAPDGQSDDAGEASAPDGFSGNVGENNAPGGGSGNAGETSAPESQSGNAGENDVPSGSPGANVEEAVSDGITGAAEENETEDVIKITISAAGDVTMGNYIGQGYEVSFRQTYDQGAGDSYFFENVYDIFSGDDLTLVNLEGPLTRAEDFLEGQEFCISGDPEYVGILTAGSVEAVSMANNHRLDYKEQGTADTVKALEGEGILYAYDNHYCMYETQEIRIGIVSVNEVEQGAAVEKYLQEGIAQLRQDGADLVFACCHWGVEREYYPEDYQKTLGRKCIDLGYDLVIGHHPHVLQGIEEYQGKFIVYSLGNFCFGANRNPADKDSMIFQQTFTFLNGERQEERDVRVVPCSVSSVSSRNDYKPTPAEGEEAQRILDKINECSRDFGVEFDAEGYLLQGR